MLHLLYKYILSSRLSVKKRSKAFTLVEILIVTMIVGTLAAIAIPTYTGYIQKNRNTTAKVAIMDMESQIERFRALNGNPPNTLAAAGIVAPNDPWGRAYIYVRPGNRWDKHDKPLNSDYDLLSMGRDGITDVKLFQPAAYDDIIRCNAGAYVGLASEY